MIRFVAFSGASLCALLLVVLTVSGCLPLDRGRATLSDVTTPAQPVAAAIPPAPVAKPAPLPDPQPLPVAQVLRSGTLIVVSKASQRMLVFRDGVLWQSSPVSTGRRGHVTPSGVFPILQKAVYHRSNKYSNAPMPYMQRLSWDGIAIHAGRLPGYAASHGCIRVPHAFARALYAQTIASKTTVVVIKEPVADEEEARTLALNAPMPHIKALPVLATADVPAPKSGPRIEPLPVIGPHAVPRPVPVRTAFPAPVKLAQARGQTIQLAAASSPALAEAEWTRLVATHRELAGFQKRVEPAVVGARRTYRLRATAANAHATCLALKRANIPCFNVI